MVILQQRGFINDWNSSFSVKGTEKQFVICPAYLSYTQTLLQSTRLNIQMYIYIYISTKRLLLFLVLFLHTSV